MTKVTNINDLHNMSVKDAARMPHPCLLADWSEKGLYTIDADAGRFVVKNHGKPRIKSGPHAGRVDLNELRIA